MKCVMCDNPKSLKRQLVNHRYTECGLTNVVLRNVEYYRCSTCGEGYYGLGNQEKLHTLIANAVLQKKGLLTGKELRFLRVYLGYASSVFAKLIGYTQETWSRLENERQPVNVTLDRLIRALIAQRLPPDRRYTLHDWWLDTEGTSYRRIELTAKNHDWVVKLAA